MVSKCCTITMTERHEWRDGRDPPECLQMSLGWTHTFLGGNLDNLQTSWNMIIQDIKHSRAWSSNSQIGHPCVSYVLLGGIPPAFYVHPMPQWSMLGFDSSFWAKYSDLSRVTLNWWWKVRESPPKMPGKFRFRNSSNLPRSVNACLSCWDFAFDNVAFKLNSLTIPSIRWSSWSTFFERLRSWCRRQHGWGWRW